jgi:hypothetical protein
MKKFNVKKDKNQIEADEVELTYDELYNLIQGTNIGYSAYKRICIDICNLDLEPRSVTCTLVIQRLSDNKYFMCYGFTIFFPYDEIDFDDMYFVEALKITRKRVNLKIEDFKFWDVV